MKFINPKVDYAFKIIFGSSQSQEILASFLNAIIYKGEKVIQSLTIVNPYNPGEVQSLKETYLDVKAILADGSVVIIEMQVGRVSAFSKRVVYDMTKAYMNQFGKDENYYRLTPVIAVTITDFILFEQFEDAISRFAFKERDNNFAYPDPELQMIFIELPKFNKKLAELTSLSDKWIYFLNQAVTLDEIPEQLGEVTEIELALSIANLANLTVAELEEVQRRAMLLQDERGRLSYAKEEGQLTEARGLISRQLKKRLGEIPANITNQIENLSLKNLENLGEDLLDFNSLADLEQWLNSRMNGLNG